MRKLILAGLLTVVVLNSHAYEMVCVDDPMQHSEPETTPSDQEKAAIVALTPEILALWDDLQRVVSTEDFKAHGMSGDVFKAWAVKQEKLQTEVNRVLQSGFYISTNYEYCVNAVEYGTAFQKDYARSLAIYQDEQDPKVIKDKNEVMGFLKNLPQ